MSAFFQVMAVTLLLGFVATCITAAFGAQCMMGEGCKDSPSCRTHDTVYCCPQGHMLLVNGTNVHVQRVCECDPENRGFSCSGPGLQFGKGSSLLLTKPADQDCKTGASCADENSCDVSGTEYCCPGGHVYVTANGGKVQTCSCRYDFQGRSCSRNAGPPGFTSLSGLTYAVASYLAVVFALILPNIF